MSTLAEYSVSIALDGMSITLKLPELVYLLLNLTSLTNQLARYNLPETDVSAYIFFEEINRYLCPRVCVCACRRYHII